MRHKRRSLVMNKEFRTVVEQPRFTREFSEIEPDAKARDEIMLGIDTCCPVCLRPESIPQYGRVSKGIFGPVQRQTASDLYYTFNKESVFLLSVRQIQGAVIWP